MILQTSFNKKSLAHQIALTAGHFFGHPHAYPMTDSHGTSPGIFYLLIDPIKNQPFNPPVNSMADPDSAIYSTKWGDEQKSL